MNIVGVVEAIYEGRWAWAVAPLLLAAEMEIETCPRHLKAGSYEYRDRCIYHRNYRDERLTNMAIFRGLGDYLGGGRESALELILPTGIAQLYELDDLIRIQQYVEPKYVIEQYKMVRGSFTHTKLA